MFCSHAYHVCVEIFRHFYLDRLILWHYRQCFFQIASLYPARSALVLNSKVTNTPEFGMRFDFAQKYGLEGECQAEEQCRYFCK